VFFFFFWIQVSSSSSSSDSSSSSFVNSGEEFDCSLWFCFVFVLYPNSFLFRLFVCCLFAAENFFCEEVTSCLFAPPISRACCCFDHRRLITCRYVGSGRAFFFLGEFPFVSSKLSCCFRGVCEFSC
jgi:hypothetical protein